MKLSGPLESQRLSFLLETAISREAQMWKVYVPKNPTRQDTDISPVQRDEVVRWMSSLTSKFHLYPETLALAISILDRFLAVVKARPKYLRCIAISCFFLGAKTNEEDERIPALHKLAKNSGCGCSPSEILRMERIILDKLNWDLLTATPLDFLQIFHAMLLSSWAQLLCTRPKVSPSQHVSMLTEQLQQCLSAHQLLQFRGSMLALAIITLELEKCRPDWLSVIVNMLKVCQIDSSQLVRCRELVARSLSSCDVPLPPNTVYIYQPLKQSLIPHDRPAIQDPPISTIPETGLEMATRSSGHPSGLAASCHHLAPIRYKQASTKRKVEEMEVDEFYDGIKRLYNEDSAQEGAAAETCGVTLVRQESSLSPAPPLQPVSVM
ncbi:LOW QUALITY PROTEIN: cyclin-I [Erpetoichthys calabaricus]|uniref:LOW QUALITY PROTEIN: cyclin-I n=1 Tax=Erpetoichthys calabaricus TaxID=27687 RepID=UPI002234A54A|nr:LOW QUALITY PROTEIN: cyclin-I [Erpetoichthys calabaricus]